MHRTGMTIYRNSTFRGRNLNLPQLPREGGMHGTPCADGRVRKPSYQNSFCCAFVRTGRGRSAALPCQGQIIPVQWSRLSGEGNCPKADNHPRASEGGSEGAIEGGTDGGNNNGRFRSLSVRWMDRGSCQAIIDERRETWRPTVCRTVGEGKEMARWYRISDQVSDFKYRSNHLFGQVIQLSATLLLSIILKVEAVEMRLACQHALH